jgi:hypothetical protein
MNEPAFTPDITRLEGAKAGGGDLATLASTEYKDRVIRDMAASLAVLVAGNLHHNLVRVVRGGDVDMIMVDEQIVLGDIKQLTTNIRELSTSLMPACIMNFIDV